MLREVLAISERDRVRLQAVASTFGGQARALQAVFGSIIELAIKNGCDAAETADAPKAAEKAVQEPYVEPPKDMGVPTEAAVDPLHVDWGRLPQGLGN